MDRLTTNRAALQWLQNDENRSLLDPLINTLIYTESFLSVMRDLLAGLAAYRRYLKSRDTIDAQSCRQRLMAAQSAWNHHTQRHGALPGTATAFREVNFWELTQRMIDDVS